MVATPPKRQKTDEPAKEEPVKEAMVRLGVAMPPADLTVRVPTALELAAGIGPSVAAFAEELIPRGKHLLLQFLIRKKGVRTQFENMPLPKINATSADCQTYKEMLHLPNARVSLERTALYEFGGSGAWLYLNFISF